MRIHIYYTVGGLKINNQLYLGYSKREALKRYRADHGLTRKHCEIVDEAKKVVKFTTGNSIISPISGEIKQSPLHISRSSA